MAQYCHRRVTKQGIIRITIYVFVRLYLGNRRRLGSFFGVFFVFLCTVKSFDIQVQSRSAVVKWPNGFQLPLCLAEVEGVLKGLSLLWCAVHSKYTGLKMQVVKRQLQRYGQTICSNSAYRYRRGSTLYNLRLFSTVKTCIWKAKWRSLLYTYTGRCRDGLATIFRWGTSVGLYETDQIRSKLVRFQNRKLERVKPVKRLTLDGADCDGGRLGNRFCQNWDHCSRSSGV